jgi:hypothetical protein
MKILAESDHAKLVEFTNNHKKLIHFGTLKEEMLNVNETSCKVTPEEIKDATFNGTIDLQYLISFKRLDLKP